MEALTWIW